MEETGMSCVYRIFLFLKGWEGVDYTASQLLAGLRFWVLLHSESLNPLRGPHCSAFCGGGRGTGWGLSNGF